MLLAGSCRRQTTPQEEQWPDGVENMASAPDTLTRHASLLTLADHGGYVSADIANPWKSGEYLARYVLVPRDSAMPEGLAKGVVALRVPLERAAVFSSVHTSALAELGAMDALAAVADGSYFAADDTVATLLKSGAVTDCGSSMSPSVEKLVASRAEAVLLSPMETGNVVVSDKIPVREVYMADYMENSPISRAEWILFLGELFGKREQARAIFTDVIDRYADLVFKKGSSAVKPPKVLTETETSGVWYVPAGESYMARMLADAGAEYPWASTKGTGSLSLDMAKVIAAASDADVWIMRTYGYDVSPQSLRSANPLNAGFKAFKSGNVYGCNSAERPIFNDIAFHPERILADYVAIFHPDVMPDYELKYYKKMK